MTGPDPVRSAPWAVWCCGILLGHVIAPTQAQADTKARLRWPYYLGPLDVERDR